MIGFRFRLVVVALVALVGSLAFAASAHAECAWVLWTGDMAPERSESRWIYIRREVYSTRDQCVQILARLEQDAKAADKGHVSRQGETFLAVPGPNKDTRRSWQCITETMKPEDSVRSK